MGLVDRHGRPLSSAQHKKATPPKTGEAFGNWAGRDLSYLELPGGGSIGFNLNNLTLSDFRNMREHYQIHSSLAVLSFLMHQSEWRIECSDPKIKAHCEENLANIWTPLSRALSAAHWSGFAPNVLQWENDKQGRTTQLAKVKDMVPEESMVKWKEVPGYAPPGKVKPKIKVYDGFQQIGAPYPIPVEATLWYPLLMENGDHYGKKLLKPAFTPWFFSMLVHLFANRYYERFGEPTPIGRAPMDDDVTVMDGSNEKTMNSRDYMLGMLQNIRNRGVIVLPNDKNPTDTSTGQKAFDYEIEYLESQMRGADFERYLTRLDEEMSIGLFTPILLLRTADVGSYNLGQGHMQIYLWMLNALNGDRKYYLDRYVLPRMVDYNFSPNAPRARIVFRKMGNENSALIATLVQALVNGGKAKVNLDQLGEVAGLDLTEVRELTAPPPAPGADDDDDTGSSGDDAGSVADAIKNRVAVQVGAAFGKAQFGPDLKIDVGYRKKMQKAFHMAGADSDRIKNFFRTVDAFTANAVHISFDTPAQFMEVFSNMIDQQVTGVLSGR